MRRHRQRTYARWWRRLPARWKHRVLAFTIGGLAAAVTFRLAGW